MMNPIQHLKDNIPEAPMDVDQVIQGQQNSQE